MMASPKDENHWAQGLFRSRRPGRDVVQRGLISKRILQALLLGVAAARHPRAGDP